MNSKLATLLFLLSCASCGGNSSEPTGGRTNWLTPCERDVDCAALSGAVCEQALCTRACNAEADCRRLGSNVTCDATLNVCLPDTSASEDGSASEVSNPAVTDAGIDETPEEDAEPSLPSMSSTPSMIENPGSMPTSIATSMSVAADSGVAPMATTSGMQVPDALDCGSNWIDPTQGLEVPAQADCPEVGQALKQGHDTALEGAEVDIDMLAGSWVTGSGSSRVELVLTADGKGTLRFGEASEYPVPELTDATFLTMTGPNDADKVSDLNYLKVHPGFEYTVVAESSTASALAFHVLATEAFDPWCALQEPVYSPYAMNCYACTDIPEAYSFYAGRTCGEKAGCYAAKEASEDVRVDCGRVELCGMPYNAACGCSATECFANVDNTSQLNLYPYRVELDPEDGNLARFDGLSELLQPTTVYLERQLSVE